MKQISMYISDYLESKDVGTIIECEEAKACITYSDVISSSSVGVINGREIKCWSKAIRDEKKKALVCRTKNFRLLEVIGIISTISSLIFYVALRLLSFTCFYPLILVSNLVLTGSLALRIYSFIRHKLLLKEFGIQAVVVAQDRLSQERCILKILCPLKISSRTFPEYTVLKGVDLYLQKHPARLNDPDSEFLKLLLCAVIPEEFYGDKVFEQYICPITQKPIRYPVIDLQSHIVYENQALKDLVSKYSTPLSNGEPMTLSQIEKSSIVKKTIDDRLGYYQDRIRQVAIKQIKRDLLAAK